MTTTDSITLAPDGANQNSNPIPLRDALLQLRDELTVEALKHTRQYTHLAESSFGLGIDRAIERIDALLAEHAAPKPTGYDVLVSEDAPTFAVWKRVTWFAEMPQPARGILELTNYTLFGELINSIGASEVENEYNVLTQRIPDDTHLFYEIVRRYRIQPSGTPLAVSE